MAWRGLLLLSLAMPGIALARLVLDLASNLVGFDLLRFALLRSFKRHLGSLDSASIQVSLFGICFVMPLHCFLVRAYVIRRISKMQAGSMAVKKLGRSTGRCEQGINKGSKGEAGQVLLAVDSW